jgi:hypothetical protein
MTSRDLPPLSGNTHQHHNLGELLTRVDDPNGQWTDMPTQPGIYLVLWPIDRPLSFREEAEEKGHALARRWLELTKRSPTDILYIGQGASLRHRLRQLVRFGRGRATNHKGGQDLWWVKGVENAEVLIQACPEGKQIGFENEALERFFRDHGHYPLANRLGAQGPARWWPGS